MTKKKRAAKTNKRSLSPKLNSALTEGEKDLLSHLDQGYQLETDSLGGEPLLRRLKDDEVIRPASANRNTVNALEDRGLISAVKGDDPLKIVWRLSSKAKR